MAMITTSPVARVYAEALMELAEEKKLLDEVQSEMVWFLEGWKKSPELSGTLTSPKVPSTTKYKLLSVTVDREQPAGKLLHDFLGLLVKKGRVRHLPSIARAFKERIDKKAGLARGTIIFAQDFGEDVKKEAEKVISDLLSKSVTLEVEIDPDILGGTIMQVGDFRLDASLRRRLHDLRERML